jgi:O-antigen ligase
MKFNGTVISTNGVDVINPVLLRKYGKEPPAAAGRIQRIVHHLFAPTPRVHGTLVYANALAGAILLLLPVSLWLAFRGTGQFRTATRVAVIVVALFLGLGALFWTGSKSGWLIAAGIGALWSQRLKWRFAARLTLVAVVAAVSVGVLAVRFQSYFASGATSVGARFDYWRAAARVTMEHPMLGTGPGTFQRPYARMKSPESEMAKLTHNDYLEQFSDSGVVGGISYLVWVTLLLTTLGKRIWKGRDPLRLGLFLGVLGWFVQGISEFSLYVPALSWTAFAICGCLLGATANEFDKEKPGG